MVKKVVFIDDEFKLLEAYSILFKEDGIELLIFDDPVKGLEYINSNDVDLCFIDFFMPQMNGLELKNQIKKEIPCILLTGNPNIEEEDIHSFEEVLIKPLEIPEFQRILKHYCGPEDQ